MFALYFVDSKNIAMTQEFSNLQKNATHNILPVLKGF